MNLIRDTRVDAKIDYKEGTVIMNHPPQSVYQQVIEKTKGAFFRTQVLRYAQQNPTPVGVSGPANTDTTSVRPSRNEYSP